jgi:hypothetical protein
VDYKAVIEEQIKQLQELQKHLNECGAYSVVCVAAKVIAELCEAANRF